MPVVPVTGRAWLRVAAVGCIALVVQEGILNGLIVGGAHPDAFLLLAVAAGLVAGPQQGAVIAFVVGLVADLFVLTPFGLSSLVYVLVAFGAGTAASLPGGRAPYGFQMTVALAGGVVGTLLFEGIGALLGQPKLPAHQLVVVAAVVGIANVVLVIPASAALSRAINIGPPRDLGAVSGGSAAR
jgi:rod shape-determining protein MreD